VHERERTHPADKTHDNTAQHAHAHPDSNTNTRKHPPALQRCGRTGAQQPRTNIARADRVIVKQETLRMSEIQEAATREFNERIYLLQGI
jgi:hypothetical protein